MIQKGQEAGEIRKQGNIIKSTDSEPLMLKDLGLDKKTSKLAQDIAKLPEEKLEAVKTRHRVTQNKAPLSHTQGGDASCNFVVLGLRQITKTGNLLWVCFKASKQ